MILYFGINAPKSKDLMDILEYVLIAYLFVLYTLSFVGLVYYFTDEAKKEVSDRGGLDDRELIIAQMKYAFVFLLAFYFFACILIVLFGGTSQTGYVAMVGILLSMAIAFTGMTVGYQFHDLRDKARRSHEELSNRKNHTLNIILQSRLSTEYQANLRSLYVNYPDHMSVPDPEKDLELNYIIQYGTSFSGFELPHKFKGTNEEDIEKYEPVLQGSGKDLHFMITKRRLGIAKSISAVDSVLNHYEFLAAGIYKDDLYEPLLFECYAGIVMNLWSRTEDYVKHYRINNNRPKTWELIEKLSNRWKSMGKRYKPGIKLLDENNDPI